MSYMAKLKDISGQKFGLLTALEYRVIKRNIRDGRSGQSYKGWALQNWDDRKLCEIE